MKFNNLDINILYRVCEELSNRKGCDSIDADFIYRIFSDIPDKNIASSIESLLKRGWVETDNNRTRLFLTDRGRSEIRSFIPNRLLSTCDPPKGC